MLSRVESLDGTQELTDLCCVQDSSYIEQPQSIANNRTLAWSVGQSASRRKEGKSPAQGAQTNQLNPLSVGPHLPHQG